MATIGLLYLNALLEGGKELTWNEALSGVFGSVSLATWVFLLVPQLILNYTTGSADGISLAFLTVWLIGDVTNLAGAIWGNLVPTVIALAVYFCIADFVLISQCLYYNALNARKDALAAKHQAHLDHQRSSNSTSAPSHPLSSNTLAPNSSETSPLLRQRSHDSLGLPGSHRRRSSVRSEHTDILSKIIEEEESTTGGGWERNVLTVLCIVAIGTAGWAIAWQSGVWSPQAPEVPGKGDLGSGGEGGGGKKEIAVGASVLGYFSAVCYLGARIPQILKNYRDKSCEGLALLFFVLSLMGNITYGLGILFHSLERQYVLNNLPWLIGSIGTMFEDAVIFAQFRMYAKKEEERDGAAVEA